MKMFCQFTAIQLVFCIVVVLFVLCGTRAEFAPANSADLEAVRGGQSPPCQSSNHEFCPNDGHCQNQECELVTLMCPDPDNPAIINPYTTYNCNASDAVYVAAMKWYPICEQSTFNGYRGTITGTADCGSAEDCYVEASQCYETPVCTPVTEIDPNTGDLVTNYYCPGYDTSWDVPVNTCTPDNTKQICGLRPGRPRFVGQNAATIASANGLFFARAHAQ